MRRARISVRPNLKPVARGPVPTADGQTSYGEAPVDSTPSSSPACDPVTTSPLLTQTPVEQPAGSAGLGTSEDPPSETVSESLSDAAPSRGSNPQASGLQRRKRISAAPNLSRPKVAPSPPKLSTRTPQTPSGSPAQEQPATETPKPNKENPVLVECGNDKSKDSSFTAEEVVSSLVKQPSTADEPLESAPCLVEGEKSYQDSRATAEDDLVFEEESQNSVPSNPSTPSSPESLTHVSHPGSPQKEKSDLQRILNGIKLKELMKLERRKERMSRRKRPRKFEHGEVLDRNKMTMRDLIYYLPDTNPMTTTLPEERTETVDTVPPSPIPTPPPEVVNEEEDEEEEREAEPELLVPRVKVAEDGSLILDEDSVTVRVERQDCTKVVEDSTPLFERGSTTTYMSFRKSFYVRPWSVRETDMFFLAISMVGLDFSMIGQLFPHRGRAELKNKFKKEERDNSWRVDKAFRNRRPYEPEFFSTLLEKILQKDRERKNKSNRIMLKLPKKPRKPKGKKKPLNCDDEVECVISEEDSDAGLAESIDAEKENRDLSNGKRGKRSNPSKGRRKRKKSIEEEPDGEPSSEKPVKGGKRKRNTKKSKNDRQSTNGTDEDGNFHSDLNADTVGEELMGAEKGNAVPKKRRRCSKKGASLESEDHEDCSVGVCDESLNVNEEDSAAAKKKRKRTKEGEGSNKRGKKTKKSQEDPVGNEKDAEVSEDAIPEAENESESVKKSSTKRSKKAVPNLAKRRSKKMSEPKPSTEDVSRMQENPEENNNKSVCETVFQEQAVVEKTGVGIEGKTLGDQEADPDMILTAQDDNSNTPIRDMVPSKSSEAQHQSDEEPQPSCSSPNNPSSCSQQRRNLKARKTKPNVSGDKKKRPVAKGNVTSKSGAKMESPQEREQNLDPTAMFKEMVTQESVEMEAEDSNEENLVSVSSLCESGQMFQETQETPALEIPALSDKEVDTDIFVVQQQTTDEEPASSVSPAVLPPSTEQSSPPPPTCSRSLLGPPGECSEDKLSEGLEREDLSSAAIEKYAQGPSEMEMMKLVENQTDVSTPLDSSCLFSKEEMCSSEETDSAERPADLWDTEPYCQTTECPDKEEMKPGEPLCQIPKGIERSDSDPNTALADQTQCDPETNQSTVSESLVTHQSVDAEESREENLIIVSPLCEPGQMFQETQETLALEIPAFSDKEVDTDVFVVQQQTTDEEPASSVSPAVLPPSTEQSSPPPPTCSRSLLGPPGECSEDKLSEGLEREDLSSAAIEKYAQGPSEMEMMKLVESQTDVSTPLESSSLSELCSSQETGLWNTEPYCQSTGCLDQEEMKPGEPLCQIPKGIERSDSDPNTALADQTQCDPETIQPESLVTVDPKTVSQGCSVDLVDQTEKNDLEVKTSTAVEKPQKQAENLSPTSSEESADGTTHSPVQCVSQVRKRRYPKPNLGRPSRFKFTPLREKPSTGEPAAACPEKPGSLSPEREGCRYLETFGEERIVQDEEKLVSDEDSPLDLTVLRQKTADPSREDTATFSPEKPELHSPQKLDHCVMEMVKESLCQEKVNLVSYGENPAELTPQNLSASDTLEKASGSIPQYTDTPLTDRPVECIADCIQSNAATISNDASSPVSAGEPLSTDTLRESGNMEHETVSPSEDSSSKSCTDIGHVRESVAMETLQVDQSAEQQRTLGYPHSLPIDITGLQERACTADTSQNVGTYAEEGATTDITAATVSTEDEEPTFILTLYEIPLSELNAEVSSVGPLSLEAQSPLLFSDEESHTQLLGSGDSSCNSVFMDEEENTERSQEVSPVLPAETTVPVSEEVESQSEMDSTYPPKSTSQNDQRSSVSSPDSKGVLPTAETEEKAVGFPTSTQEETSGVSQMKTTLPKRRGKLQIKPKLPQRDRSNKESCRAADLIVESEQPNPVQTAPSTSQKSPVTPAVKHLASPKDSSRPEYTSDVLETCDGVFMEEGSMSQSVCCGEELLPQLQGAPLTVKSSLRSCDPVTIVAEQVEQGCEVSHVVLIDPVVPICEEVEKEDEMNQTHAALGPPGHQQELSSEQDKLTDSLRKFVSEDPQTPPRSRDKVYMSPKVILRKCTKEELPKSAFCELESDSSNPVQVQIQESSENPQTCKATPRRRGRLLVKPNLSQRAHSKEGPSKPADSDLHPDQLNPFQTLAVTSKQAAPPTSVCEGFRIHKQPSEPKDLPDLSEELSGSEAKENPQSVLYGGHIQPRHQSTPLTVRSSTKGSIPNPVVPEETEESGLEVSHMILSDLLVPVCEDRGDEDETEQETVSAGFPSFAGFGAEESNERIMLSQTKKTPARKRGKQSKMPEASQKMCNEGEKMAISDLDPDQLNPIQTAPSTSQQDLSITLSSELATQRISPQSEGIQLIPNITSLTESSESSETGVSAEGQLAGSLEVSHTVLTDLLVPVCDELGEEHETDATEPFKSSSQNDDVAVSPPGSQTELSSEANRERSDDSPSFTKSLPVGSGESPSLSQTSSEPFRRTDQQTKDPKVVLKKYTVEELLNTVNPDMKFNQAEDLSQSPSRPQTPLSEKDKIYMSPVVVLRKCTKEELPKSAFRDLESDLAFPSTSTSTSQKVPESPVRKDLVSQKHSLRTEDLTDNLRTSAGSDGTGSLESVQLSHQTTPLTVKTSSTGFGRKPRGFLSLLSSSSIPQSSAGPVKFSPRRPRVNIPHPAGKASEAKLLTGSPSTSSSLPTQARTTTSHLPASLNVDPDQLSPVQTAPSTSQQDVAFNLSSELASQRMSPQSEGVQHIPNVTSLTESSESSETGFSAEGQLAGSLEVSHTVLTDLLVPVCEELGEEHEMDATEPLKSSSQNDDVTAVSHPGSQRECPTEASRPTGSPVLFSTHESSSTEEEPTQVSQLIFNDIFTLVDDSE